MGKCIFWRKTATWSTNFKFQFFWEHPLYEISEYAFKLNVNIKLKSCVMAFDMNLIYICFLYFFLIKHLLFCSIFIFENLLHSYIMKIISSPIIWGLLRTDTKHQCWYHETYRKHIKIYVWNIGFSQNLSFELTNIKYVLVLFFHQE